MLLFHYLYPRPSEPFHETMITTDIHANRLYITHLLTDMLIQAVHVEYLLYHLSLLKVAIFENER